MHPVFRSLGSTATLLLLISSAFGDVTLAPLFQDHMVLQREKPISVWGWAEPAEKIAVTLGRCSTETTTDARGRWTATLPAHPANAQPETLVVKGSNTLTVHDVLVGEVWLCSGQSNMGFPLRQDVLAPIEIPAARQPQLRQFKVAQAVSATPQATVKGRWEIASPETAGEFTAVGYYFGRDLQRILGVPVGLINSTWGGTPVEAWLPADVLSGDAAFAPVLTRWQEVLANYPAAQRDYELRLAKWETESAEAHATARRFAARKPGPPLGPGHHRTPAGLYNGMIHPLIPYTLRGMLWYQGEGNAAFAREYHALFAALISSWRERFAQGDVPFYWVQLPNFKNTGDKSGENWAWLREAQTQTLSLPNTAQAVTIDVGDPDDIHPTNKSPVGSRLLRLALDQVYGRKLATTGPRLVSTQIEGDAISVRFDPADGGKLFATREPLESFELAGADRMFHPAVASLDGDTVRVRSAAVPVPVAVRYAWKNNPVSSLKNSSALPAAPFRSDEW